jgi:hypothetical protein
MSNVYFQGEVLSLYKCHMSQSSSYKPMSVNVCVRTVEGQLDDDDIANIEENTLFLGTSALLFLLPAGAPFNKSDSVSIVMLLGYRDTFPGKQYSIMFCDTFV